MSENDNKEPKKKGAAVSLDKKIKIFEEYLQTGEEIIGSTVYKGYPIGQWAIQIRQRVNNFLNANTPCSHYKDEQLKKLKEMGILQRQRDCTIDEKVDLLIQWKQIYPDIELVGSAPPIKKIREHSNSEADFEKLLEEYVKMQHYYIYISGRKSRGKLKQELLDKCKEAELKPEVFGYPKYIEDLSKRYGIENKDLYYIINKFKSIEQFVLLYRSNRLNGYDLKLAQNMIRRYLDINQNPLSFNYEILLEDLYGSKNELVLYSSQEMNEVIDSLTPRQQKLIRKRYGLEDGKYKKYLDISEEEDISKSGVGCVIQTALSTIKDSSDNFNKIFVFHEFEDNSNFETQKCIVDNFKKEIDKSNIVFINVSDSDNDFSKSFYLRKLEFIKKMAEIRKLEKNRDNSKVDEENEEISIEEIGLSLRAKNCLKRAEYTNISDIENAISDFAENEKAVYDFLLQLDGCGEKSAKEIKTKLKEVGVKIGDDVHGFSLDFIRQKRDELQEELSAIKAKENKARELLEKYNDILGENKNRKGQK